jgi:hypothetical protein
MSHARRADWAATVPWSGILGKPELTTDIAEVGGYGFAPGQIPVWNGAMFIPGNSGGGYSGPVVDSPLTMTGPAMLGRSYVGTGEIQEITVGTSIELEAGNLNTIQEITTTSSPVFAGLTLNNVTGAIPADVTGTVFHQAQADGVRNVMLMDSFAERDSLIFRRANGTSVLPTALAADDQIGSITWRGYGDTDYSATSPAYIVVSANENWTDAAQGTRMSIGLTPNGSNVSSTAVTFYADRVALDVPLRLNNAYVAGVVVATGTVTLQDSTGNTYRVPVLV